MLSVASGTDSCTLCLHCHARPRERRGTAAACGIRRFLDDPGSPSVGGLVGFCSTGSQSKPFRSMANEAVELFRMRRTKQTPQVGLALACRSHVTPFECRRASESHRTPRMPCVERC